MAGKAAEIDIPPPLPGFSVSVLDVPVFRHRLVVMAALAKGLPVFFVPEQVRVAAMRLDMIHNSCRNEPSFLFASDTPRMTLQEELPGLLPLSPVATQRCILPFPLATAVHVRHNTFFRTARASDSPDICTGSAAFLAFVSSPASKKDRWRSSPGPSFFFC